MKKYLLILVGLALLGGMKLMSVHQNSPHFEKGGRGGFLFPPNANN